MRVRVLAAALLALGYSTLAGARPRDDDGDDDDRDRQEGFERKVVEDDDEDLEDPRKARLTAKLMGLTADKAHARFGSGSRCGMRHRGRPRSTISLCCTWRMMPPTRCSDAWGFQGLTASLQRTTRYRSCPISRSSAA